MIRFLTIVSVFIIHSSVVQAAVEKAIFAGGCFWCMEPPFEKLNGVFSVISGFTGGHVKNPSYKAVSSGGTGHVEAVEVSFDSQVVSYKTLLQVFWRAMDPTDNDGQFVDRGGQYAPGIYYLNAQQKEWAEDSKSEMQKSKRYEKPIVLKIQQATEFYAAEDSHQDYYKKNPVRYKYYRYKSGRDQFLDKIWGKDKEYHPIATMQEKKFMKPDATVLKSKLTDMQFKVTQKEGTEPPFKNEYWDNKKPGIYVDVVSGEPLFSSTEK